MPELRLTQKEVISLPTQDESIYTSIMNCKLKESGFDLAKTYAKNFCFFTKELVYTQN